MEKGLKVNGDDNAKGQAALGIYCLLLYSYMFPISTIQTINIFLRKINLFNVMEYSTG